MYDQIELETCIFGGRGGKGREEPIKVSLSVRVEEKLLQVETALIGRSGLDVAMEDLLPWRFPFGGGRMIGFDYQQRYNGQTREDSGVWMQSQRWNLPEWKRSFRLVHLVVVCVVFVVFVVVVVVVVVVVAITTVIVLGDRSTFSNLGRVVEIHRVTKLEKRTTKKPKASRWCDTTADGKLIRKHWCWRWCQSQCWFGCCYRRKVTETSIPKNYSLVESLSEEQSIDRHDRTTGTDEWTKPFPNPTKLPTKSLDAITL